MRYSKTIPVIISVCAAIACAQNVKSLEIDAATESARLELRNQLMSVYIAPGVPLGDVVRSAPGLVDVDSVLNRAESLGQPRWVGQDIVQVKLHLNAAELVKAVEASRRPLATRMSATDFDRFQTQWGNRSFQATGQAIPAARIREVVMTLRPTAWAAISDNDRADTARRAHSNATGALIDQTDAIRISPAQTVDATLMPGQGKTALMTWADTLPATNVTLSDDRQIEIGLYVDKPGLTTVLKSSLQPAVLTHPAAMQALTTGIHALPDVVVGRAVAEQSPAPPRAALVIRQIPAWAGDPITAEGEAKFSTTQLRTARAAERTAREALREKLLGLKVDGGVTLGEAPQHDTVRAAIDEAIENAKVYQVDYHADGSATVRVTLDPNDLLDALTVK